MAPNGRLHDRLNHVSHWDINVTDLERSRKWYEANTNLRVITRTTASQDFPGINIINGSFGGYMMKDKTLPPGSPMIHLVEWSSPRPVGQAYSSTANAGWCRMIAVVENIDEARKTVLENGCEPFHPTWRTPLRVNPTLPEMDFQIFLVRDPDGVCVEFCDTVAQEATGPGTRPLVPLMVAPNTAQLEKNLQFYVDVIGLDFICGVQTPGQVFNAWDPSGGQSGFSGAFLSVRGAGSCFWECLQWMDSPKYPTPYKEGNHVGVVRLVIEVDNVEAAQVALKEGSHSLGYDVYIGEVETWDFGPEMGARKVVNFQDPEGVAYQLIQQPLNPSPSLHPYGVGAETR